MLAEKKKSQLTQMTSTENQFFVFALFLFSSIFAFLSNCLVVVLNIKGDTTMEKTGKGTKKKSENLTGHLSYKNCRNSESSMFKQRIFYSTTS